MRISLSLSEYGPSAGHPERTTAQAVRYYAAAGFAGCDLAFYRPEVLAGDWKTKMEEARAAADACGCALDICHLPFHRPHPGAAEEEWRAFTDSVLRAIDAAAFVGVTYCVMHANASVLPDFDLARSRESALAYLAPFKEHADRRGVQFVVENLGGPPPGGEKHRYTSDPGELCELCDLLGAGVCWDTGHANRYGLDQWDALHIVGKRLRVLHVNDNFGGKDDHLPPFFGKINWYRFMDALRDIGYAGDFNMEIIYARQPDFLFDTTTAVIYQTAKHLLDYQANSGS